MFVLRFVLMLTLMFLPILALILVLLLTQFFCAFCLPSIALVVMNHGEWEHWLPPATPPTSFHAPLPLWSGAFCNCKC